MTEERLNDLSKKLNKGESVELSKQEQVLFQEFCLQEVEIWEPWWTHRSILHEGITDEQPPEHTNLNEFV